MLLRCLCCLLFLQPLRRFSWQLDLPIDVTIGELWRSAEGGHAHPGKHGLNDVLIRRFLQLQGLFVTGIRTVIVAASLLVRLHPRERRRVPARPAKRLDASGRHTVQG